jgi:UDP-N-acetyl-D-glucosamine dehydrogenase
LARDFKLNDLIRKIEAREAIVGIVGMGYVGLPLALRFTEEKFRVLGFDIDNQKINNLNRNSHALNNHHL